MLSGATTCSVTLGGYRLLVVDEVGYIPLEPEAANLFFQLVSRGPLSAAPTAAAKRCLTPSFGRSRAGSGPGPSGALRRVYSPRRAPGISCTQGSRPRAIAAADTTPVVSHNATVTAAASSVRSRLDVRPGLSAPGSPGGRRNNRPLAQWRKARAVDLATHGHTYQQIADELGYANRGTVHRLVQQTLHAHQADSVDQLRALEVARLDALQQALWERAMAGDLQAVGQVVQIIVTRSRLLGLIPLAKKARAKCRQPQTVVLMKDDCRLRGCPDHT